MPFADEEEALRRRLAGYVSGKPFHLNPAVEVVAGLIKAMIRRRVKMGEYYCPCRVVTGDREQDRAIICPCDYHLAELEDQGYCHCRLFVAGDADAQGGGEPVPDGD